MAGEHGFSMVADSKLVSYSTIRALLAARVRFIARAPAVQVKDEVYAALDLARATVVDWTPDREAGKPAERRETYRMPAKTHTLTGPRKSDPALTVRRILVHSTANAADRQAARDKRLAKATEDLNRLTAAAGGRHYKTREKIVARIGVIAAKRRVVGVRLSVLSPVQVNVLSWWCADQGFSSVRYGWSTASDGRAVFMPP
ncbi:hypothetical protein [Streptomyces canus]|uniref:hypothetical protein n=1 Tax=Streptomyces canus TaxID=58343 RepID=UPI00131A1A47|nr:hypothetical protein [Streptomyces canus]